MDKWNRNSRIQMHCVATAVIFFVLVCLCGWMPLGTGRPASEPLQSNREAEVHAIPYWKQTPLACYRFLSCVLLFLGGKVVSFCFCGLVDPSLGWSGDPGDLRTSNSQAVCLLKYTTESAFFSCCKWTFPSYEHMRCGGLWVLVREGSPCLF